MLHVVCAKYSLVRNTLFAFVLLLSFFLFSFSFPVSAKAQDLKLDKRRVFRDRYIVEVIEANTDKPSVAAARISKVNIDRKLRKLKVRSVQSLGQSASGEFRLIKPLVAAAKAGATTFDGSEEVVDYDKESDYCVELIKSGAVKSCSPDYEVKVSAVPNDPSYSSLWGMNPTQGIDAPSAWDVTQGSSSIVVAVVDTGIDYNHPDLAANMWVNSGEVAGNGIDDDGNGYIDDIYGWNASANNGNPLDDNGHGTHCAGTIGGKGNNALGVAGVNWNVKMMALKFLSATGSGSLSNAINALNYMVTMKKRGVNVRVSSNSWGGGGFSQALFNVIQDAQNQGIIFVGAAGNESNNNDLNPAYPASYDLANVVSVAAVDQNRNMASFSNYGASQVDIAAPGVGIFSTFPNGGYTAMSGTSMATPHVAGALALLLANEPWLTATQAIDRLYLTGVSLPTLNGVVRTGRMLNAGRMIRNTTSPLPITAPPAASCTYAAESASIPASAELESATALISADEYNYTTVSLPFTFPFYGEQISSLIVSPNGIVYTKSQPTSMDYKNSSQAPLNSIAALHGDLTTQNAPHAVKVKVNADNVVIFWYAEAYTMRGQGSVHVHLTIHASGVIEEYVGFDTPGLLGLYQAASTIGVTGTVASDSTTYAYNSVSQVKNGMGIRFTPQCESSTPPPGDNNPAPNLPSEVSKIKMQGVSSGKATSSLLPGKQMNINLEGSGSQPIEVKAYFNNYACSDAVMVSFADGAEIQARMPRVSNSFSSLKIKAGAVKKAAQIRHASKARSGFKKNSRSASKVLNKFCTQFYNSFIEM